MNFQRMIERCRSGDDSEAELRLLGSCGLAAGNGVAQRRVLYRADHQCFRRWADAELLHQRARRCGELLRPTLGDSGPQLQRDLLLADAETQIAAVDAYLRDSVDGKFALELAAQDQLAGLQQRPDLA